MGLNDDLSMIIYLLVQNYFFMTTYYMRCNLSIIINYVITKL